MKNNVCVPMRKYPPLETVTRPTVTTNEAAFYLNRKPQTLHEWSSEGTGVVSPARVNGRLAWPTAALRRVLGVTTA